MQKKKYVTEMQLSLLLLLMVTLRLPVLLVLLLLLLLLIQLLSEIPNALALLLVLQVLRAKPNAPNRRVSNVLRYHRHRLRKGEIKMLSVVDCAVL